MHILLVGGTGVLSSAITNEAINQGIKVTMINRGNNTKNLSDKIELIKSDRKNYNYIRNTLEGRFFDAIIDFLCYTEKDTTDSFNLYKNFTKQYFFISSCAVYNTALGGVMNENSPKVLPIWNYSVEKWASEQHLHKLAINTNCKYTIIRPCVTYGDTRIPYGISPTYGYHWTLCARILADKPIIRWNGGVNRCNMTRVEDFAVGVVGLIGNHKAYNEAFNICGEEMPSFNDVLSALEKILNHKVSVVDVTPKFYAQELPNRAGEILGGRSIDTLNSNKKIKEIVPEFEQKIKLEEGISKTITAYKAQKYQQGIDWFFDADCDRIILKWCKKHNISTKSMNLHFIDYLGNATYSERIKYWMQFNKNTILGKFIFFVKKVRERIKK